jgi:hypothetical protein
VGLFFFFKTYFKKKYSMRPRGCIWPSADPAMRLCGRKPVRADAPMRPRGRISVPPLWLPALDGSHHGMGLGSHQGGNAFLPFPITNCKAWPYISHSCLPRLWLVEVGAINFASTVLPTCEEVRVTFTYEL